MRTTKRRLQKATALFLATIMMLSAFAMMPTDLFKASAAEIESFDNRVDMDFNNNWKFYLGNASGAHTKAYDDSSWKAVELPHDFSISQNFFSDGVEAESGNLPGGTGWYRKMFVMPATCRDKTVILNFDGAYKDTYVYVNGTLVGENHYGYNSFSFDISRYLNYDNKTANIIAVKVEHQLPSSRWYSGSGIYRDVTMTVVDPVHVDLYGVQVTTPNIESSNGVDGTVYANVTLDNDNSYAKTVDVKAEILDATGTVVGTSSQASVTAQPGVQTSATLTPVLSNPNLWNSWDLGSPYLYTLRTTVSENGKVIDTYDTEFGYRWFEWHADNGFSLNGTNLKLEGVCMHHDQGALGSVQEYDAIYRQVMILKDMGCNTIRTSHGTPSRVFMEVCNELGMLVMNEFFDGWDTAKNSNTNDFSVYFDTVIDTSTNKILNAKANQMWYEFVVTQSVMRDRNDPSIVIWDVGNELNEGASTGDFTTIASNLQTLIDNLDPTRPICQGNNGPSDAAKAAVDGFMDVIGGNYNMASWISLMTGTSDNRSTKPYVGTETASALATRGEYSVPNYHSVLTMTNAGNSDKHITAYDNGKVSWGEVAASAWYNTITYDWNSGEYVWTGFDYIGEPTPWNNTTSSGGTSNPVSSYFGIIDTAGFAKDTFYLYRSWWNEHSTTLHIVPGTWDSSELYVDSSGYVDVAVYSNAKRIELLGDGNVIATATSTTTTTNAGHKYQTWTETANNSNVNTTEFYTGAGKDFYPQFHVKYSAYSEISVKAYDANGNDITDSAVGTKSVSNVSATRVKAETWSDITYTADGDSFVYIEYSAVDANGNLDTTYNGTINVTLNGDEATIVGVDNGNQATTRKFQQSSVFAGENTVQVQMFNGKALVVVRTNEEVGDVEVTAESTDSTTVDSITFTTVVESTAKGENYDEFEEVVLQPDDLVYEQTLRDEYDALYNEIMGGSTSSNGEADYAYYPANPDGSTRVEDEIPDGWYIITGADSQGGATSSGVLTHTAHTSGGFVTDGSTGSPAASSDAWYFEKQSDGKYYVYYEDDNGNKQYLTISNNQVYVSTAPYALDITRDLNGNVTIAFGSAYLTYQTAQSDRVWYSATATNLKLYYVGEASGGTTTPSTPTTTVTEVTSFTTLDGEYIITGQDDQGRYTYGAATHTLKTGGLTPSNTNAPYTPDDNNTWIFEKTSDGFYYIYYKDSSNTNRYLVVNDGNVTTSTTATKLTVSDTDGDGKVIIGNSTNEYQLNYYGNSSSVISEWNPGTELTLYKVTTSTPSGGTATKTIEKVTVGSTLLDSGWYVLAGSASNITNGAITHTVDTNNSNTNGLETDGTTGTPSVDADEWYFEKLSNGKYYIYYTDNSGIKHYMNIGTANYSLTLSTTAQELTVGYNANGQITVGNGTQYINFCGNSNHGNHVITWSNASNIDVYKITTHTTSADGVTMWLPTVTDEALPPVEDGEYVIYDANFVMGGETSSVGLSQVAETPSSGVISTATTNAYTFKRITGTTNQYYVKNSEGKYLYIGTSSGSIGLSDSPSIVYISGNSNKDILIYSGNQALDHYVSQGGFNTWTSSSSENQLMTLYRNENPVSSGGVPSNKQDLYDALYDGIQIEPGTFSSASYETLFTALKDGWAVFEDENASATQIANATSAITTAYASLGIDYKTFGATLYKYGYNGASSTPYNMGASSFNSQTFASMEAIIRADDNIMAQIEQVVLYDADGNERTWLSDTEKQTAISAAVTKYARIYSLVFSGNGVADSTASNGGSYERSLWNAWCKTDTQGAGEAYEDGASVQGIFSALSVNGLPADHADYYPLPYGNHIDSTTRQDWHTYDGIPLTIVSNGSNVTISALPALEGISVHINDVFAKEDVYANGTDASGGYSKYYWDFQMPFITTTNEYGINTYVYSSSNNEYVFQAEYDDENHTATAQLTPVDSWSITRDGKGQGSGFFPFNYQKGVTSYSGEKAIYHFGMTFATDFYIPVTGTYADGEDVVFEFSGDDDVLVYIDNVLVLDNGGLHGARAASINFTDASISYQYAMDIDTPSGLVESTTENAVTYMYGVNNANINADELAALQKLNEVRSDGEYHTFTFYYLERGSTDSNCEIKFNLQQASEHILLHDQTLVLDYGLPVEYYYVQENDEISDEAKEVSEIEYIGLMDANKEVDSVVTFGDPENISKTFERDGSVLDVNGLKYGTANMTQDGYITYEPSTIHMTGRDFFYFCAAITNDPTYATDTTYYQYERINFIPATTIYYEDNFGTDIVFKDGTVTDSTGHGVWTTVGDASQFADAQQAADLSGDPTSNPYGFDPVYAGLDETKDYTQYSGFSAHKVTVSSSNLPKNGGTCPTIEFTFTGTGFDVISMTDSTTGVYYMEIFDENGTRVGKRNMVDTYYGYSYGQLFADASGKATFEVTDRPLYKSADNEATTLSKTYYATDDTGATIVRREVSYLDVSGNGYTDTPTYYDADGNLTTTETEDVAYAYAYAYGWITTKDSNVEGLYQIPVIKKTGLDHGTYKVVITPMYTAMTDNTGNGQFDLYFDAIRVYHPAEKDPDNFIHHAYRDDNELHPHYLEIKDILIGVDSLSKDGATKGVVFIDGIAALEDDLEKYKVAGPNNEVYLAAGHAIAFEIWASAIPDGVQIGVKSAKGTPKFSFTYNGNTVEKTISTATEMNYHFNSMLPTDGKLTWTRVNVNGDIYYKTSTVVIQNTADDDSLLSLTSMKWTFTGEGQFGHYEVTLPEGVSDLALMSTSETITRAYSMMSSANTPETDDGADEDVNEDAGAEIIPGDNEDVNDTNDEYQEQLSWIQKIIKAITGFFKKIFGLA